MNAALVFAVAFIALWVGHQVGDYLAQSDWMCAHKGGPSRSWQTWAALAAHVTAYSLAQLAALAAVAAVTGLPLFGGRAVWVGLAFSALTHAFIDRRWPVVWYMNHTGSGSYAQTGEGRHHVDQALHHVCLFVSALIIAGGAS